MVVEGNGQHEQFVTRFPKPTLDAVRLAAAEEERFVGQVIRRAVKEYLEKHHPDLLQGATDG